MEKIIKYFRAMRGQNTYNLASHSKLCEAIHTDDTRHFLATNLFLTMQLAGNIRNIVLYLSNLRHHQER